MNDSFGLPFSITRYLCGKWTERTIFIYLIVNKEGFLTDWSENITPFYGIRPNREQPADDQLMFLQGFLPYSSKDILVLEAVNFETKRAADIHLVPAENEDLCILMFDVTESLKLRQELQQKSNDIQLLYEQELRSFQNLKQAYQHLEKQRKAAEEANRAKTEFLSKVTHDLKDPLNAIMGFSQLLESSNQPLDKEQKSFVDEIKKSSDYLLCLINDLLSNAKLENKKIEIKSQSLNPAEEVKKLLSLLMPIAEKHKISIINRMNSDFPPVWADPIRFRQIMINFLSNAVKYNRSEGSVIVNHYLIDGNIMRITVKDTGIGIENKQLERVFEAYERGAAEKTEIEGTGIGLNVCKQLAQLMAGSVGVNSDLGAGSVFWVDLPLDKNATLKRTSHLQQTVLYIDQNQVNFDLIHNLFGYYNVDFVNVTNLNEAAKLLVLEKKVFNAIFINISQFKKSYFAFMSWVKSNSDADTIPVIAIFDRQSELVEVKTTLEKGVHDYLYQPFDFGLTMILLDQLIHDYDFSR